MSKCNICNSKIPFMGKFKVKDGIICGSCSNLSSSYSTDTIEILKSYYQANENRKKVFHETQRLKSILSDIVSIDDTNRLFYIVPKKKGFNYYIYSFDEVVSHGIEYPNTITKTETKGGISRAIIGTAVAGPVGAIVGASTAKQVSTTTNGRGLFYLNLNTISGSKKIYVYAPPLGFSEFLDKIIVESNNKIQKAEIHTASIKDPTVEILKYKDLLDKGIITEKEFEKKKNELLNL